MLRIIALALIIVSTGCIGPKTRNKVTLPAVQLAAPGVQENVNHGITVFPDPDGTFDREGWTFRSDDFFTMIIDTEVLVFDADTLATWTDLREFATFGIQQRVTTGVWGPGVGESATERLNKFEESLNLGVRR